jgi:hypothetical protein
MDADGDFDGGNGDEQTLNDLLVSIIKEHPILMRRASYREPKTRSRMRLNRQN